MPNLITVYWRDIPAQVMVKQRREKASVPLTDRFAVAIDDAAMAAGLMGSDGYLEQWRRVTEPREGDLDDIVNEAAFAIEEDYDDARLQALVASHGNDESAA